jgi:hypothetical protein
LLSPLLLLCAPSSFAHDHWINAGGFKAPNGHEWCCNENDCLQIPGDTVSVTSRGYLLRDHSETVPYRETLPSQDGAYWRCQRPDGTRRCFFAPPPGT